MAIIKPFRALRPVSEKAKQVSCVPYDVVDEREVREFIEENPLSFLRVTRPEAEFPEGEAHETAETYQRAAENLNKYIEEGILTRDAEPGIYIYRLSGETHSQTGIVACCSLEEYEAGKIKKHEKTRPDKVEDRTAHMVSLKAQSGLIFLTFRGTDETRRLISEASAQEPIYDFHCSAGIRQTVWRAARPADFVKAFEEVPALYVADGHHRVESANLARKILRGQNPEHTGEEDYNFVVAGIFPAEDLRILAYNRVVKDLNGLSKEEFLGKIGEYFIASETGEKEPAYHGDICMYLEGKWYKLTFSVQFFQSPGAIESLDASILQNYILKPILGIEDPRTDTRIGFIGGARGTGELEKTVDEGAAAVAFSMFPTTMGDLLAVSDMGEIMPPKSTWFEPKLKDGLLIHLI